MIGRTLAAVMTMLVASAAVSQTGPQVRPVAVPVERTVPLPTRVSGRVQVERDRDGVAYRRQWPGSYFETAFAGRHAYFRVGPGDVSLRVLVDGRPAGSLVRPAAGLYAITGLSDAPHRLRVQVVSESQAGPSVFGGFSAGAGTSARPLAPRARRIEFIGDSHTVGYGNSSAKRACTGDEVWATTDTSEGIAGILGRRYDADYRVNAISGRGVVRNYDGFRADTLPEAYPFTLLDRTVPADDRGWQPQVVVVSLGTNDFTTALHPGERWTTRADLRSDFRASYVRFVQGLRARYPRAFFVLWATDMANGEIDAEVRQVAARLRATGETRLAYVPVPGLTFAGCDNHPSVADDQRIAERIRRVIDARPGSWRRR